jgi:hypothetical protein
MSIQSKPTLREFRNVNSIQYDVDRCQVPLVVNQDKGNPGNINSIQYDVERIQKCQFNPIPNSHSNVSSL